MMGKPSVRAWAMMIWPEGTLSLGLHWFPCRHKFPCVPSATAKSGYKTRPRWQPPSPPPTSRIWNTSLYTVTYNQFTYRLGTDAKRGIRLLNLKCDLPAQQIRVKSHINKYICINKIAHGYSKNLGPFTIRLPFNRIAVSRVLLAFF